MSAREDEDYGSWAGAYALGALTPDERNRYEQYLHRSEDARAEAAEFGDTAALLGSATEPVAPSAELRANLLAAIASTPQLPAEDPAPSDETTQRAREDVLVGASTLGGNVIQPAAGSKAARRWSRPVAMLAAAAAVVVLGVGVAGGTGLLNPQSEQQQAISALEDADDLQRVEATATDGTPVSVLWSEELASAAITSDDMPELADDLVYQLWMIRDGETIPAGLMEDGETSAVMDGELHQGDVIGITVEPAGGSEAPTTAPILLQAT